MLPDLVNLDDSIVELVGDQDVARLVELAV
jgi:hypothetical protein